ncbi:MAG: rhodanese-like domain-containing protein [Desulfuromonadales bacterium]|nr:rhodanese-like domain-containing protein [Desulfuromonadales bacterium]NIR34417.1 rhodanese-like domain-containing protein [Desulfuromonadales bacterium]NIS44425.1 rhodanese-like domain-containing protein [Desulfuromonadales bacterium]
MMVAAVFLCSVVSVQAAPAANINASRAFEMVEKQEDLYILDVRTPQEFFQARLEGAKLIPISQLQGRVDELPKSRPILVYCAVGSRSGAVASYLARLGFDRVYNLYGGIYAWQLRRYPVLKGPG